MAVYIILAAITIVIATCVVKREQGVSILSRSSLLSKTALASIFVLLFGVSACRYQVGNDYSRYEEFFHLIPLKQVVPTEWGFNKIVLLMQYIFGADTRLTIFALFAFLTILFMLLAVYEQSDDFAFSFFLFITFGYYFQSLNTVRYYLAWAAALYSMKYVLKKQWGRFLLTVIIMSTIHKSVLLVLPVYFLASFKWKKWHYAVLLLLSTSGLIFKDLYLRIIMRLYPSYENTAYLDGGTSLINIIKIAAVLVFAVLCCTVWKNEKIDDEQKIKNRFYFQLNFLALLLYLCGSFIPEISRVGYYLTAGQIFLLPSLTAGLENEKLRRVCRILILTASVVYFCVFLVKAQALLVRIVPYHTWMFSVSELLKN